MQRFTAVFLLIITILSASPAWCGSFFDQFVDPKDGNLDMSQWLAGRTGFLPIPILISDPAVGYGGGLAVAFFHESKDEPQEGIDEDGMLSLPPSVSFLVGAVTENSSWFGAGGHVGSWKNDSIRYTGAAGYADFNLRFYGIDPDQPPTDDNGLAFNIEGFLFLQELTFRIKESKLDSDFTTILQGFSSGLIDVDSLVGDLTQTSRIASLFINELL